MDADAVLWELLAPAVYAVGGWVIAVCILLAILFVLVDSLRVDRFKIFSKRMLGKSFK